MPQEEGGFGILARFRRRYLRYKGLISFSRKTYLLYKGLPEGDTAPKNRATPTPLSRFGGIDTPVDSPS